MLLATWTLVGSLAISLGRRPQRWAATGMVVAALVSCSLFVPLPASVETNAIVQPTRMDMLAAIESGWIHEARSYGETIPKDSTVLRIESPELEKELAALDRERRQQKELIDTLIQQSLVRSDMEIALVAATSRAEDLERQWDLKQLQRSALRLTAPFSAILLPPDVGPTTGPGVSQDGIRTVSGSASSMPLGRLRRDGYVQRGEVIARLALPGESEALLLVPENERSRVFVSMPVEVRMRTNPRRALKGEVREIAELSRDLRANFSLALQDTAHASNVLSERYYVARVTLNDAGPSTLLYGSAKARFKLPARSTAQRLVRWWNDTFYFGKSAGTR